MKYSAITSPDGIQSCISKIILGSANFGTDLSTDRAFQVMDYFYENGGNTIDTARVYSDWIPGGRGASEKTIGGWMKQRGCRKHIFLITKGGHPAMEAMHTSRLTKSDILSDLDESLQALNTDRIDLYFLHRDDESIPVEQIMDTLDNVAKSGKVNMIGASNWKMKRILEANAYAAAAGKTPFSASEIQWSYAKCRPETFGDDTLVCMDEDQYQLYAANPLPVMAFSSQAGGVFSCSYRPDLSDMADKHKKYYSAENVLLYQELLKKCAAELVKPETAALRFITENPVQAYAIIGCSSAQQLQFTMEAVQE